MGDVSPASGSAATAPLDLLDVEGSEGGGGERCASSAFRRVIRKRCRDCTRRCSCLSLLVSTCAAFHVYCCTAN